MLAPIETAKLYFDLSNNSDFEGIAKLFTDTTTYSSGTTGVYLGKVDIMTMQRAFHSKFKSLHWEVISVKEVKPNIILFDYEFTGEMPGGEKINSTGLEYVVVYDNKIQHVEIRNRR